jgi:hypothetical protein
LNPGRCQNANGTYLVASGTIFSPEGWNNIGAKPAALG